MLDDFKDWLYDIRQRKKRSKIVYICMYPEDAKKYCHYLNAFDKTCMHPSLDSCMAQKVKEDDDDDDIESKGIKNFIKRILRRN